MIYKMKISSVKICQDKNLNLIDGSRWRGQCFATWFTRSDHEKLFLRQIRRAGVAGNKIFNFTERSDQPFDKSQTEKNSRK